MCDFYFKYFKKELIIIIWNKYNKRTTKIWGYFGSNAVKDEPRGNWHCTFGKLSSGFLSFTLEKFFILSKQLYQDGVCFGYFL